MQATAVGDQFCEADELVDGGSAVWIVDVPQVEAQVDETGDDVGGTGLEGEFADGGDESLGLSGDGFHLVHPLDGAGEGVLPEMHGGGAGVIGVAAKTEAEARLA